MCQLKVKVASAFTMTLAFQFCVLVILTVANGKIQQECDRLVRVNGMFVYNCSNKEAIEILEELPPEAEVLDFSGNFFTELPQLNESPKCPETVECPKLNLTVSHCRMDVSFRQNKINRFNDKALTGLRCLQSLDLSHNEINADKFDSTTFQQGAFYLLKLNLSHNPLSTLHDHVITSPWMPYLRVLDLSHCDLEQLGRNSVDDHTQLEVLDLSYNKLKELDGHTTFKGLSNLTTLDLRHNMITSLSENLFGDLINLKHLWLSDNRIASIHNASFYNDTKLKLLHLQNNQLSEIPYQILDKLPLLESLDLSNNPITHVTGGPGLYKIKYLSLNRTLIRALDSYALASFSDLVTLSISDVPQLSTISSDFLGRRAPSLREVILVNNGVARLSADALPWKQLTLLRLSGNPWFCDSDVEWMLDSKTIEGEVICGGPSNLAGHDIRTINPKELPRYFSTTRLTLFISLVVAFPVAGLFAYLVWKRRRHFNCLHLNNVRGRYVSVVTRDTGHGVDETVAVEMKVHFQRLKAVSNGEADSSKPFIKMDTLSKQEEEEEI
ncbi:unnamed protein product [Lymnaea stagnalis]|uniref:Uncharacterized protein n=1 Tax=Lymnaea stagnalis TaxID=6523 RepID=A0AAV2I9Q8_LYMST